MKNSKSGIFSRLTNQKQNSANRKNETAIPNAQSVEVIEHSAKQSIIKETYSLADADYFFKQNTHFLESIDSKMLLDSIATFKSLDLKTVSDTDLADILGRIVQYNSMPRLELPEGDVVYRARNHTFKYGPASDYFRKKGEIWYAESKHLTKYGRLNKPGQPMFYASPDAITPIYEIRSGNNTQFALMKYSVKKGQKLNLIAIATESYGQMIKKMTERNQLSKKAKKNYQIIHDFLYQEFTKKVPSGQEYQYRSTNELLVSFNAPGFDGYVYPSIERGMSYNLAIKPDAVDRAIEFKALAYYHNNTFDKAGSRVNLADFYCHQKWSVGLNGDKIVYEPDAPCPIYFEGMPPVELGQTLHDPLYPTN